VQKQPLQKPQIMSGLSQICGASLVYCALTWSDSEAGLLDRKTLLFGGMVLFIVPAILQMHAVNSVCCAASKSYAQESNDVDN